MARFFAVARPDEPAAPGLPVSLACMLLRGLLADVRAVRAAVSKVEMRMIGASLLVVYEGDWAHAEAGFARGADGEDDVDEEDGCSDESTDEEDDDEDEGQDEDEEEDTPRRPYVARLIDFAHTRPKPGEGADEGVLLGLDTVIRLLEGRLAEIAGAEVAA